MRSRYSFNERAAPEQSPGYAGDIDSFNPVQKNNFCTARVREPVPHFFSSLFQAVRVHSLDEWQIKKIQVAWVNPWQ
jgi:hypothetical protein